MIKKLVVLALLCLLPFIIAAYFLTYGFGLPSCRSFETVLEASILMQTSDIIFEKQMYYVTSPSKEKSVVTCQKTIRQQASGFLTQDNQPYDTPGYQIIPIPQNTKFTLVRMTYIEYKGYSGESVGSYYLFKNDKGEEWYIRPIHFLNREHWGGNDESKWVAGYYKDGNRLGEVTVQDIWKCNKNDNLEFCSEEL